MRAGQAAAQEASRRRAAEACAEAARERLGAYWARHRPGAGATIGLPPRWTDNSYYQQAEKDARELAHQKDKEKKLEERRNKLSLLLYREDLEQKEELKYVALQNKQQRSRNYLDSVPTSTLREVNLGIRAKEEERRRAEAEILLYHQWRANQPLIREHEVRQRNGALKTAWMEQIIDKEIAKKKDEEETDKILEERDKCIKRQIEKEKEAILLKDEKMKDLQEQLCKQISDLRESETAASQLRKQEEAESALLKALRDAGEVRRSAAKQRAAARAVSLSNMAMQARRLKERAKEAEKDVEADMQELLVIAAAIEKDAQREDSDKKEWRAALDSAVRSMKKQKDLEQARQKHLITVMDGEARVMYQKQEKLWQHEHIARQSLLNEVLSTLEKQVKERLEQNRAHLRQNILDRELALAEIEKANRIVEEAEREKERSAREITKITSLQEELRRAERKEKEKAERKERDVELREAMREEERLRQEIIRLQKQGSAFNAYRRRRYFL